MGPILEGITFNAQGGGFKVFSIFFSIPGEMIQFDEHVFQGDETIN